MYRLLKVNGPRGVLPSVYYNLEGQPVRDDVVGDYMCRTINSENSRKGDLIVKMTEKEFKVAEAALRNHLPLSQSELNELEHMIG